MSAMDVCNECIAHNSSPPLPGSSLSFIHAVTSRGRPAWAGSCSHGKTHSYALKTPLSVA
eukprot:328251-Pelagomonas_calceolata.AAC.14